MIVQRCIESGRDYDPRDKVVTYYSMVGTDPRLCRDKPVSYEWQSCYCLIPQSGNSTPVRFLFFFSVQFRRFHNKTPIPFSSFRFYISPHKPPNPSFTHASKFEVKQTGQISNEGLYPCRILLTFFPPACPSLTPGPTASASRFRHSKSALFTKCYNKKARLSILLYTGWFFFRSPPGLFFFGMHACMRKGARNSSSFRCGKREKFRLLGIRCARLGFLNGRVLGPGEGEGSSYTKERKKK